MLTLFEKMEEIKREGQELKKEANGKKRSNSLAGKSVDKSGNKEKVQGRKSTLSVSQNPSKK